MFVPIWTDPGSYFWGYKISVFDLETNAWLDTPGLNFSAEVSQRFCPLSVFAYNGELYMFGYDWSTHTNVLWKLSLDTFSWNKVEPKGKGPSCVTSDVCCGVVGDRVILLGHSGQYREENPPDLYILDLSPTLKTLCQLAVARCGLDHSQLPQDVRWELQAAMTANKHCQQDCRSQN